MKIQGPVFQGLLGRSAFSRIPQILGGVSHELTNGFPMRGDLLMNLVRTHVVDLLAIPHNLEANLHKRVHGLVIFRNVTVAHGHWHSGLFRSGRR